jgi:hypothetical protein
MSKRQIVPLVFVQDALAASQSNVQLTAQDSAVAVDGITMPVSGEVLGISYDLSAAGSAGSLTVGATLAGTENASTTQSITTATSGKAVFPRGTMPFDAGAILGAEITTDASWNGTTADLAVTLWVALDWEGS